MFDITTFFTFLFSLALVIGLMYGAVYLLKRLGIGGMPLSKTGEDNDKRKLEILEFLPLDTKRRLVRVRVGKKEHVLLTGPNNDLLIESDEIKQKELQNNNDVL